MKWIITICDATHKQKGQKKKKISIYFRAGQGIGSISAGQGRARFPVKLLAGAASQPSAVPVSRPHGLTAATVCAVCVPRYPRAQAQKSYATCRALIPPYTAQRIVLVYI